MAAQKLLAARDFVPRFRDASEADTLGRVIGGPSIATSTAFTNSGVIRVNPNDMCDEAMLVHEYGHFAQERIGAYLSRPGCSYTLFLNRSGLSVCHCLSAWNSVLCPSTRCGMQWL